MSKHRFKAGDTITNGRVTVQVQGISKDTYKLSSGRGYMPIVLVDRLWGPALEPPANGIYEGEIEE